MQHVLLISVVAFVLSFLAEQSNAQQSIQKVRSDPRGQYQVFKRVAHQRGNGHSGRVNPREEYSMTECAGLDVPESKDRMSTALLVLAFEVAQRKT